MQTGKKPDYENAIKESISAVEAMCCIITGQRGAQATLGKTIKKLKESSVHIHPAMESAFSSLLKNGEKAGDSKDYLYR